MSTEAKLWQRMSRHTLRVRRWWRVECDTATGIPDVYYVPLLGLPGWLELKVAIWRGGRLQYTHPPTPQQVDFLRSTYDAGVPAHILVGHWGKDRNWSRFGLVPAPLITAMDSLSSVPDDEDVFWSSDIPGVLQYLCRVPRRVLMNPRSGRSRPHRDRGTRQ